MNTQKIITTIDLLKEAGLLKIQFDDSREEHETKYQYESSYENFIIKFEKLSDNGKRQVINTVKVSDSDKQELFTIKITQEMSYEEDARFAIYIDGKYIENKEDQQKLLDAVPLNELMQVLDAESNKNIKEREDALAPEIKSEQLVTNTLSKIEALRFKLDKPQVKPT